MPAFDLSPIEIRILGCLIEKERTTPENYPLSLHALTAACNQSTNREPITAYDEGPVENGVNSLRTKKLATVIFGAGARVQKYRHNLLDHFELNPRDVALLCVLLLRGAQTPGELRARTERMGSFKGVDEVEAVLAELAAGDSPLVRGLPTRPGQKERRYVQILSGEPAEVEMAAAEPAAASAGANRLSRSDGAESRVEGLEKELAALRSELERLREEFSAFRKQFE